MKRCRTTAAFTLVELLVVLAVLALLAALLFPVFHQAKEMARLESCMTNLQQSGRAVLMYVQDNDENFLAQTHHYLGVSPENGVMAYAPEDGRIDATWMSSIYSYSKKVDLNVCPSAQVANNPLYKPTTHSISSYAYNGLLGNILHNDWYPLPDPMPVASLSGVARPAECMLLQDEGITWSRSQPAPRWNPFRSHLWCNAFSPEDENGVHKDGFVVSYADGHAKVIRPAQAAANLDGGTNTDSQAGEDLQNCLGNSHTKPRAQDRESIYNPYKP